MLDHPAGLFLRRSKQLLSIGFRFKASPPRILFPEVVPEVSEEVTGRLSPTICPEGDNGIQVKCRVRIAIS